MADASSKRSSRISEIVVEITPPTIFSQAAANSRFRIEQSEEHCFNDDPAATAPELITEPK
jgi:hypothetical protein